MKAFAAIDFETATRLKDSACAVGAVRVERGRVVERYHRLLRPPSRRFELTAIHGIAWPDVAAAPSFARAWPELRALLRGVDFVVAHGACFDLGVLHACCARAGVPPPRLRVECTQARARAWGLGPATLGATARHLGLSLPSLRAGEEAPLHAAEACAAIALTSGLA